MYQTLFIMTAIVSGAYFLFSKRTFDYFSVAYFSAVIYFLPGFFGYTSYHIQGVWINTPLNFEAYLVMLSVLASISISAYIGSFLRNPINLDVCVSQPLMIGRLLFVLSLIGLALLIFTAGATIASPEKDTVLESLGRWYILFSTAATIGLPIAYFNKQRILMIFFVGFLLFDLYIGFRSSLAIAMIAVLTILISSRGKIRIIMKERKIIFFSIVLGVFFFGYKLVAFAIKSGSWSAVIETILDLNTFQIMITQSEPFITQQILNTIISEDFHIGIIHITSVISQFILFGPELGLASSSFNDLFQPILFPAVEYGMASNIWAQMWSLGSWPLLILFIFLYNLLLAVGNSSLRSRSFVIRAGLAPVFVYLAFYIHRNDLGYIINIEKRLLIILAAVISIAYIFGRSRQEDTDTGNHSIKRANE